MGTRLDGLAGFTHSSQRNRYLNDLVLFGHIRSAGKRGRADRYELLTNMAAEQALREFLREDEARWWREYEADELPFQQTPSASSP
jgi:hypothetical protein